MYIIITRGVFLISFTNLFYYYDNEYKVQLMVLMVFLISFKISIFTNRAVAFLLDLQNLAHLHHPMDPPVKNLIH